MAEIKQYIIHAEDFRDKAWGVAPINEHTELVLEMSEGYSDLYYRDPVSKMPITENIFFEMPGRKEINEYCRETHNLEFVTMNEMRNILRNK